MSQTIDTKIVEMEFDNKDFEKNVQQSMSTLDKLKLKLDSLKDSGKGLDAISKSAKSFTLDDVGASVERLEKRFSGLGIAGMTAISEITKSAMQLGSTLIHKVLDPINSGGQARAQKIEDAKFTLEGLGIAWSQISDDINYGVADTAYGLDAAAKAAASLSASSVKVGDDMRQALRGISGVAAQTNSSYEEIAQIFTKVAGNGRLMGMELTQLSSKGMNAAAVLGKQLGKTEAEIRDMVSKGKIDFATFSKAMDDAFGEHAKDANRTFQGITANIRAALSKIGELFYEPILRTDGPVVKFLQEVRLRINDVKKALEPLAKNWANLVFNLANLGQKFLASLDAETIASTVENFFYTFMNLVRAATSVIQPFVVAWKEVFAGTALGNLNSLSEAIKNFTEKLILNRKQMANIRDAFKGVFDVVKLLGDIFVAVARKFLPFVTETDGLLDIITKLLGIVGRTLSFIVKLIREGQVLQKIFNGIKTAVMLLAGAILYLVNGLIDLVAGIANLKIVQTIIAGFTTLGSVVVKVFDIIKNGATNLVQTIGGIFNKGDQALNKTATIGQKIVAIFSGIGSKIKEAFGTLSSDGFSGFLGKVIAGFQELKKQIKESLNKDDITWFDILIDLIRKTLGYIAQIIGAFTDFAGAIDWTKIAIIGFLVVIAKLAISTNKMFNAFTKTAGAAKGFFDTLTKKIKGVEKWKPSLLEDIAICIGTLAVSLKLISTIPAWKLDEVTNSLLKLIAAVAGFSILTTVIGMIAKLKGSLTEITAVGISMAAMAGSVLILVVALKELEDLKIKDIMPKIALIGGIAVSLGVAVAIMSRIAPKLSVGALAILALGFAVKMVVSAITELTAADLSKVKGNLANLTIILGGLSFLAFSVSKVGLGAALGLLGFALAWKLVGTELTEAFNSIDYEKITPQIQGAIKVIGALAGVVLALDILTKQLGGGIFKLGMGIGAVALAIAMLAKVTVKLSDLVKKGEITKKGIITLAAFSALISAFSLLSRKTQGGEFLKFAIGMDLLMVAFSAMASLMYLIGQVQDPDVFKKGLWTLAAFTGMIAALEVATMALKGVKLGNIIAFIVLLSATFVELVALSLIPFEQIAPALLTMTVVMGMLTAVVLAVSQLKDIKIQSVLGILALVGVMATIGVALKELSKYSWQSLAASGAAMSVAILIFAKSMQIITKTDGRTFGSNKLKGMLAAVAALATMGAALYLVSQNDWHSILSATVPMAACFAGLIAVVKIISQMKIKKGNILELLEASLIFIPVGAALWMATQQDWPEILSAMVPMAGCLLGLAAVLRIISGVKVKPASAASLLIASLSLIPIGAALKIATVDTNWQEILAATVPMVAAIAALGVALGLLSAMPVTNLAVSAASLVIASVAFLAIGKAISFLVGVPWQDVWTAVGAIAALTVVFVGLGALAGIIAPIGAGIILLGAAFTLFGAGVLAAGAGMNLIITALNALNALGIDTITGISSALTTLAPPLAWLALLSPGLLAAGAGLAVFAVGLAALGGATMTLTQADSLNTLADGLRNVITGAAGSAVTGGKLVILAAGLAAFAASSAIAVAASNGFVLLATNLSILGAAILMFGSNVAIAIDTIANAVTKLVTFPQKMKQAASDGVTGFVEGINAGAGHTRGAGEKMGLNFLNGFRKQTGWHSPWETMKNAAIDAANGIINGVKASSGSVEKAGGSMGQSFINGLMSKISAGLANLKAKLGSLLPESFKTGIDNAVSFIKGETNLEDVMGTLIDPFSEQIEELTENVLDGTGAFDDYSQGIAEAGKAAGKAKDPIASLSDTIAGQMDIFSEFNRGEEISAEQMLNNMASQIAGVSEWAANIKMLAARGIDEGLLQKLTEMGPQGAAKVRAFASMTEEQLQQANRMFQTSLILPQAEAAQIGASFKAAGYNITKGLADGMDTTAGTKEMAETCTNIKNTADTQMEMNSPSKVMYRKGQYIIQGMEEGIRSWMDKPVDQMTTLSVNMKSALYKGLPHKTFYDIGYNVGKGLSSGIEDSVDLVTKAINKVTNKLVDKARKNLDEHSPSKVFYEIGQYVDEGLANGMTQNALLIDNASDVITDKVINDFQNVLANLGAFLDGSLNLNPLITPVLNTDDISAEIDKFNQLFGNTEDVGMIVEASRRANAQQAIDDKTAAYQMGSKLLQAVSNRDPADTTPINVNITLQGDAAGIFRVVREENTKYIKSTGSSPLYAGG